MTKPIARDPIYRRRRFEGEFIELCVRWYISYRLSYRDLVATMAAQGYARRSHTEPSRVAAVATGGSEVEIRAASGGRGH
jgi:transposase-like protein